MTLFGELCSYILLSPHNLILTLEVQKLVDQYADIFSEPTGIPPERALTHSIPLVPGV
jgi:hypothetical protein